jgi:copper chaperone CopZ
MNIDGELEDTQGVIEAKTSYARGQVEVKFDEEKISSEKIKEIIIGTGYQV